MEMRGGAAWHWKTNWVWKALQSWPGRKSASARKKLLNFLKAALTDEITSREIYTKGIDHSYYYEGYTTDEIARILGQRPGTVRSHLSRARDNLRKALTAEL